MHGGNREPRAIRRCALRLLRLARRLLKRHAESCAVGGDVDLRAHNRFDDRAIETLRPVEDLLRGCLAAAQRGDYSRERNPHRTLPLAILCKKADISSGDFPCTIV